MPCRQAEGLAKLTDNTWDEDVTLDPQRLALFDNRIVGVYCLWQTDSLISFCVVCWCDESDDRGRTICIRGRTGGICVFWIL